MNTDVIRKIYDAMSAKYAMSEDFNTFASDIQDKNVARKVYDAMYSKYQMEEDFDTFYSDILSPSAEEVAEDMQPQDTITPQATPEEIAQIDNFNNANIFPQMHDTNLPFRTIEEKKESARIEEQIATEEAALAEHREAERKRLHEDGTIQRMENAKREARRGKLGNLGLMMLNGAGSAASVTGGNMGVELPEGVDIEQVAEEHRQNKLLHQRLDETLDMVRQGDINAEGSLGIGDATRGAWDSATRLSTWDVGISETLNALTYYDLVKKWEENPESLTATENALLDAIAETEYVNSLYSDQTGFWYGVGQSLPQSAAFMGETMLNPVNALGQTAMKKVVRELGKRGVSAAARRGAGITTRVVGDIAEAAIGTATTRAGHVIGGAIDRNLGSMDFRVDNNGYVHYEGQEDDGVGGWEAMSKEFGAQFLGGYSEKIGATLIDPALDVLRGVTKGAVTFERLDKFVDALNNTKASKLMNGISNLRKKAHLDSTLAEILEEEFDMLMNARFIGDNNFGDPSDPNSVFNLRNQLTTIASTALTMFGINAVESAGNYANKRTWEKKVSEFDKAAGKLYGDGWESLRESIDMKSPQEVVDELTGIFMNQDVTLAQKRAIMNYAMGRIGMQSYNVMDKKVRDELYFEKKNSLDAYEAGRHAQLPQYYNIDQEYRRSEAAINERENAEEIWDAIRLMNNMDENERQNIMRDFSEEDQELIRNWRYNSYRWEGAVNHRDDQIEDLVDEYAGQVNPYTRPDGTVTTAILGDNVVYVMNEAENGDAVVYTNDGRKIFCKMRDLEHVQQHNAEELIERFRQQTTEVVNQETEKNLSYPSEVQEPAEGVTVETLDGKQWQVAATDGENVEIVGLVFDKKSGQWIPNAGDYRKMTREQFMDWQKAELDRKKANTYEQGDELTFYVNGEPISAEITGIDPDGNYYVHVSNLVEGLDKAVSDVYTAEELRKLTTPSSKVSEKTTENDSTSTEEIKQSVSEEVTNSQIEDNVTEPTAEVAESVDTALSRVPKDAKGNPLYEQTDADTAWDAIMEQTEGDVEMAQRIAEEMVADKKAALTKMQKGKPKKGATVAEKIANEKAHIAAIAQAEQEVAAWEKIAQTEARRREAAMSEADRYAAEMEQKNISEGLSALGEPQSLQEYVLAQLAGGAYKLRWNDKENGTKGFGSHTGLSAEEMKARLSMIDNKNGLTPEEIAHSIVENMDASFGEVDVMDVTDMVIDAVSTYASRRSMLNGMVESRAELIRQQEIAEQEAKDAWYMEQYHATEEELAAYNEYLAEFAEEIYGEDSDYEQRIATFAEIQLEYDNQGTDAGLRSSADQGEGLASDREGGRSVGETEQLNQREVLADAAGVAASEDQGIGGSVSAESDAERIGSIKTELGVFGADNAAEYANRLYDIYQWKSLEEANEVLKAVLRSYDRLSGQTLGVLPYLDQAQKLIKDSFSEEEVKENMRRTLLDIGYTEEEIAAAERDGQRYEADMAEDAAETVETLENGDVRRTNRNSNGEIATVVIERDGNVISVDTYEDGALFERTDYDANGNATKVTRYKDGDVVSEQEYKDGKRKVTANVFDMAEEAQKNRKSKKKSNDKLAEKNRQEERKEGSATTGAGKSRPSGTFSVSYYTQFLKELFQNAHWEERPSEEVAGIIRRHNAGKTLLAHTEDERELLSALRALTNNEIQDELSNINNALQSDEYTDEEKEELKRAKNLITRFVNRGERNAVIEALTGAKLGEKLPLSKIDELFEMYNSDANVAELYARVRAIAEQIGLDFWFEEMEDRLLGGYLHSDNRVRLNAHTLYSPRMQRQGVASTIVHEMLHAVVGYAVKTQQDVKMGLTPAVKLSKQVLNAANTIAKIYEKAVKGNPALVHQEYDIEKEEWVEVADYGTTSVEEMLVEISNPEFRDKLKQIEYKNRSVWQWIVDTLKSMFTKSSDVTNPTAYDSMAKALDVLINEFSVDAYQKYSGLEESAMKLSAEENLRFRDGAPFFSNAERAVENIKQQKATPEQWLAMIKKDGGLKAGEDKWMGLSDWLNEQKEKGVKSMTKDEVLAFIRENQIEIEEVEYESNPQSFEDLKDEYEAILRDEGYDAAHDAMVDRFGGDFDIAFEDLGGELAIANEEAAATLLGSGNIINSTRLDYTTEGLDNKREIALVVPTIEPWNQSDNIHFGDAGEGRAVAWVRFGEATDEDGNRVLVIDEVQSKRHDEGRAKGYKSEARLKELEREYENIMDEHAALTKEILHDAGYAYKGESEGVYDEDMQVKAEIGLLGSDEQLARRVELSKRLADVSNEHGNLRNAIPDAPFDKNYHEVVMKRMLRYAAENGFDKVAWTKGKQQAQRYDLAKHVSSIEYKPLANGHYNVIAYSSLGYPLDGVPMVYDSEQAIAEVFGKDIAQQIAQDVEENRRKAAETEQALSELKEKRKELRRRGVDEDSAEFEETLEEFSRLSNELSETQSAKFIEGTDLSIGDEDRNALYDEMIPRFMNKYVKKWGTKVGEATLPNVEEAGRTMWSVDVTPEMRESVMQGQPMFREGMGAISDREVSYENDPIAKWQGKPRYYGKRAAAFAERERARMQKGVEEAARILGIEVEIITDASTLQGRKAKAKGWYDINSKKVVVVIPNHVSKGDAVRTVLHEGVAHHGLRELFGDGFDNMLDNVYNNVAPELKARIDAIAGRTGVDTRVATEEYLARLSEDGEFEYAQKRGWWHEIKRFFLDMFRNLGLKDAKVGVLTDNELRFILWRSYKNLTEPNYYAKPLGYLDDVTKQKELKVGEYAENTMATPKAADVDVINTEAEEWTAVTMQRIEELEAQAVQLENEIADIEADRDADDESRYDVWEQQIDPLRKQLEDVYAEIEGLYSLEAEDEDIEDYEAEREAEKQRQLYQKRIDNAYLKAVREGDWEEATDLFRQYVLSKAEDEGIVPMDYGVGYRGGAHSSIAKKVKEENPDAIAEAAYQMSIRIPKGSILVPMPSRTGNATYTVKLAEAIARATDSEVRDVLKGKARMSIYEAKQKGIEMTPEDLGMYTTEELPKGKNIVIIDNVIDKGTTALAAVSAVKGASVVAYAYTLGDKQRAATLKLAEPVTYDDNKRIIPLSQRFDKETDDIRYRLVDNQAEIDRLESEPTIKAYRAMQVINGELYPPMSAVVDGKLREPIALGQWERSEERPELADDDGNFKLNKGNKKSPVPARYNPYFHSSATPLNDQFAEAQDRPNLVTVEVEIPQSEADGTSGYKAEKAKDAVGAHQWKAGAIQGQISGTRTLYLSRWDKPVRIVPDSEVAGVIAKMLEGTGIVMPSNVVTPSLRAELEKLGVPFVETTNRGKLAEGEHKGEGYGKVYGKKSTKKSKNKAEIIAEIEREAAALGVPVRIVRSVDELPDEDTRKRAVDGQLKGYFDPRTGEVALYEPNTDNANDAKRTILHETVGHKGLRQLIGEERYDKAMVQLMYMLPSEVRDAVLRRAERHGWNAAIAMDEYLAEQAERDVQPTWWGKVNAKIRAILRNLGFNVRLTDADVTYLLWRSRKKLMGDTAFDMATNAILKQAARKSAEADAWNEQAFKDAEMRDFERGAMQRLRNRIGDAQNEYDSAMKSTAFKQRESWQDSMRSLKVFMDIVSKESGKKIADWENAYMYENAMSSANLMEMQMFRHDVYGRLLKAIHELMESGAKYEEVVDYMMAKHGLERNEKMARKRAEKEAEGDAVKEAEGDAVKEAELYAKYRGEDLSGLTALTGVANVGDAEAAAMQMVSDFEAKHNTDLLWNETRACTQTILNISHDAGILSDEVYGELWNQYEYYIPLRGFEETTAEEVYTYVGDSKSPYNAPIKTAKGRKSKADDPIATIATMAESAIVEANRNRLKQRFLYMVERHRTELASVSSVWVEKDPITGDCVARFANIPNDATPEEAAQAQKAFEERMEQLHEQEPERYYKASEKPNIPYRVEKKANEHEHQVIVKRGGKDVVITINGDPRVAQAINGLTNPEAVEGFDKFAGNVNRFLSANFTTRNPAFVVSNFVRDGFYTNSMVWAKESPAYAWKYNQNWAKAAKLLPSLVSKYKRYEKGDKSALDMSDPVERAFYEFMINGGETGYTVINSVEDYKGIVAGDLRVMQGGVVGNTKKAMQAVGNVLDTFGRWAEDTSRFAAFLTSREMGRSVTKSIWDAKEISVNFNKKGSGRKMTQHDKGLNSILGWMSQQGRNLYVFWNAGMQGMFNFGKAVKEHPGKMAGLAGVYFGLGMAMAAIFGGHDDDDEDYWNLPEYVRRNNICFRVGNKFVTLPLPIELRAIYGMGELAMSWIAGKEDPKKVGMKVVQQMSQVMPIDMMAEGGGLMAFVPSWAKPIVEVGVNTDWTGMPIYRERTPWNEYDPQWMLAFKSTSPELVAASRAINEATNKNLPSGKENKYDRGWADIEYLNNPAAWGHIAEGYLGGLATMFGQTKKSVMAIWNEDLREVRNAPVISRFLKDAGEKSEEYALREDYFNAKGVVDELRSQRGHFRKESTDQSLTEEQRKDVMESRIEMEKMVNATISQWNNLENTRKRLEDTAKDNPDQEVTFDGKKGNAKDALDEVTRRMVRLTEGYQ